MELNIYDRNFTSLGVIDEIDTFIWTRRYWSCGEFKLLVPLTEHHIDLLLKKRLIMKHGDTEAGEIRYINKKKNLQGLEQIEVQGKFITHWLRKRLVLNQIVTTDRPENILERIVTENVTDPPNAARKILNIYIDSAPDFDNAAIEYASERGKTALFACESAAKASELGFQIYADIKQKRYHFRIYKGNDLTSGQTANPPCVFSQEFDNILEQEYTNSIENYCTTAYVSGEEKDGVPLKVVEVGGAVSGLDRDEVFIKATDIKRQDASNDTQYADMLSQRGASELEKLTETLFFSGKVNIHSNLKYKTDYDLGDIVTCVNERWGVKVDVRITEISEIYQGNIEEIEVAFGEGLPTLLDKIRNIKG